MMENLRRLVWKVESLSGTTNGVTKEKQLPAIPEEHEDVSSHHSTESNQLHQLQSDQNNLGDAVGGTPQIHSELNVHDVPDTTAVGELGEETETIFYMFPVKHDTPLGEWMMGKFECLYYRVLSEI